jgi:hypothetical protein
MFGTVYSIKCKETGDQYIGSTCKHVEYRLEQHRQIGNKTSSRPIIDRKNFECIILESVICDSKAELLYRERHFIETEPNVVNKCRPIITVEERKASVLAYEHAHPDYFQKYRDDHKEHWQSTYVCECKVSCRLINRNRHERSTQHKTYIKTKDSIPLLVM